jgi:predicted ATPase/DNA-binding CsgD family transcriptional regulator
MRLIGRDAELEAVGDFVGRQRLVTLTGQGGIGKTRLAAELVARRSDASSGRASWVDLTSIHQGSDVLSAFLSGCRAAVGPKPTIEDLLDLVHARGDALLVVDNCEHVLDDSVMLIERMIDRCPGLSILATSRLPLEIPGEVTWRLSPLTIPKPKSQLGIAELSEFGATALFIERSQQAAPGLNFENSDAATIKSLCSMVDGNPLAIQLAAARVPSIGLEGLHATLSSSLGILDRPGTRGPTRQRSVTASLRWSYDLLDANTQRMLRALSVFEEGFDLDTAVAITTGSAEDGVGPAGCLARLVEVGFIGFDPANSRYRLLYTVRQFAVDELRKEGEAEAVIEAHARYWVLRGARATVWGADRTPDQIFKYVTDLRSALRWAMTNDPQLGCVAIASYGAALSDLGSDGGLSLWCNWLLALQPRPADWSRAVSAIAPFGLTLGHPGFASAVDEASELATSANDSTAIRQLRIPEFYRRTVAGNFAGVREFIDEAEQSGDAYAAMALATHCALMTAVLGGHDSARYYADAARRAAFAGGLPYRLTVAAIADTVVLQQRGELDAATRVSRAGVDGSPAVRSLELVTLALLALDRGDHQLMEEAVYGLQTIGPVDPGVSNNVHWAHACLTGNWIRAKEAAESLRAIAPYLASHAPTFLLTFATTCAHLGEWTAATETLDQIEAARVVVTEPTFLAEASVALLRARAALAESKVSDANRFVYDALQVAWTNHYVLVTVNALETLAVVSLARGNERLAAKLLGACEARRLAIGYANRDASAATDEHRSSVDPALFDEAHSLTISDTVALALRSRGTRRRPLIGPESLTPTERSVAELAADGKSNQEISGQLLMSVPTVKTHLSRTFSKLGIANRAQLSTRLL